MNTNSILILYNSFNLDETTILSLFNKLCTIYNDTHISSIAIYNYIWTIIGNDIYNIDNLNIARYIWTNTNLHKKDMFNFNEFEKYVISLKSLLLSLLNI